MTVMMTVAMLTDGGGDVNDNSVVAVMMSPVTVVV